MSESSTQVRYVPNDLSEMVANAQAIVLAWAQGVSTHHVLYLLQDEGGWGTRLVYIEGPEGGPVSWMHRWATSPQDVTVWDLPDPRNKAREGLDVTREALHYVMDQAMDEVVAEQIM